MTQKDETGRKALFQNPMNLMAGIGSRLQREMERRKGSRRRRKVGMAPGVLMHVGERKMDRVQIMVTDYSPDLLQSREIAGPNELTDQPAGTVRWIRVAGLHDTELMGELSRRFDIHPLLMEDILNPDQRPKMDVLENLLFVVLRRVRFESGALKSETISIVRKPGLILTFHEEPTDVFDPIRERLKVASSRMRRGGSEYLTYAMMDVVMDHFLLVMDDVSDVLEVMEDAAIRQPDKSLVPGILELKRTLIGLQKIIRPMRDIATRLSREPGHLFKKDMYPYLQDLWDHVIYGHDALENAQQMATTVLELYYSSISHRMNEVMKVLTIIATIFIPLSFIVGLYGMNFEYMPELKWRYGYFAVWGIIVGVMGGMLIYFKRKKWF